MGVKFIINIEYKEEKKFKVSSLLFQSDWYFSLHALKKTRAQAAKKSTHMNSDTFVSCVCVNDRSNFDEFLILS